MVEFNKTDVENQLIVRRSLTDQTLIMCTCITSEVERATTVGKIPEHLVWVIGKMPDHKCIQFDLIELLAKIRHFELK